MALVTPSGGLVYHLRALRYGRAWRPFRAAVERWLTQALPPSEELVLVGPSAGHCLPLGHLRRFERLLVLEPDALARALLRRRLRAERLELRTKDELVEPLLSGHPGLSELLSERPRSAVLFCNLLGQVTLALSDERQARFESEFRRRIWPLLEGRRWASFHDHWSLDWDEASPVVPGEVSFERRPTAQSLGRAFFGATGDDVPVMDHGTSSLFPEQLPRRYFSWPIAKGALHIVEALPASR
jgi:hypothetical protein